MKSQEVKFVLASKVLFLFALQDNFSIGHSDECFNWVTQVTLYFVAIHNFSIVC